MEKHLEDLIKKNEKFILYNLLCLIDKNITRAEFNEIISGSSLNFENIEKTNQFKRLKKAYDNIFLKINFNLDLNYLIELNSIISNSNSYLKVSNKFGFASRFNTLKSEIDKIDKEKDLLVKIKELIKFFFKNSIFEEYNLVTGILFINNYLISNNYGILNIFWYQLEKSKTLKDFNLEKNNYVITVVY